MASIGSVKQPFTLAFIESVGKEERRWFRFNAYEVLLHLGRTLGTNGKKNGAPFKSLVYINFSLIK